MKISFVTTVLNEEESIGSFLNSLNKQSKKPDEIVIVDGGSSDLTVEKIQNSPLRRAAGKASGDARQDFAGQAKFKVISKKGNRSVGRNEAIKKATGDIILVSDAGCILDKNWIKNITEPFFDKSIDVVSGYYIPIANNVFEKCLATYTCVMSDKVNPDNYLPSSRSIAFRKYAWKKVNGYPEYLDTCEDLVFAKRLKMAGFNFKFAKNAIVYWQQKTNLKESFWQFFNYARGDGQALYFRKQTPLLFIRVVFFTAILIIGIFTKSFYAFAALSGLLILYILLSIMKNFRYINKAEALYILPSLQIISDIAVFLGTTIGLISGLRRTYNLNIK